MLSVKRIAKLTEPGRYSDANGLYLQVGPTGARSWLLRYQRNHRERWLGLGPLHAFSLDEARERARQARQLLADGIDPIEHRKAERTQQALEEAKAVSFKQCAQQFYEAHEASWNSRKHRMQFMNTLRDYAFPTLGALPVGQIDEAMVLAVLRPIWSTKGPTARRLRHRIAAVLDYAAAAKYRTGTNPARWEGHLEHLLADPTKVTPVVHHPALPYAEVAAFIADLRGRVGVSARALEFLTLTATRTGEVIGARWSEIDLKTKTWTIPSKRMKASKEHRVPLSDRAMQILTGLPREMEYVFVGQRAGTAISSIAMLREMKRLRPDFVPHGLRSTFRDWAAERTSYPNHVVEMALAHSIGDAVEAAYRRGDLFDQRQKLMQAWPTTATNRNEIHRPPSPQSVRGGRGDGRRPGRRRSALAD
jgi:integrase